MINRLLLIAIIFTTVLSARAQEVSTCIAAPYPVTVKQPDGSSITVIGKGNAVINYTETADGYTVVKNNLGIYEYAKRDAEGDLLPSGVRAHDASVRPVNEVQYLQSTPKSLRYSDDHIKEIHDGGHSHGKKAVEPENEEDLKGVTASFPSKGKHKVLLILIEYPDLPSKYKKEDFIKMLNDTSHNHGKSFRDFYLINSRGQLDLEVDVVGWYTATNDYLYYGRDNGNGPSRELVAEAVDSAEAHGVDFSHYDNDQDGDADGILVIHSGPGAEEGSQTQYIWSHRSSLWGSNSREYDNTEIDNYAINPETRISGNRMVGIGVLCHEFGHLLGLPDLYDVDKVHEGIGNWCLMAGGPWLDAERTPASFSAWCKIFLGWETSVTIDSDSVYTLKPAATTHAIYRVNTPVSDEYFLLENRQPILFDEKLPGKGMAIWHIDDYLIQNTIGPNRVNADVDHKGVDLEEADNFSHLDKGSNRGDAGDLYPGFKEKIAFDDATSPNAKTYDGNNSGVKIFNITELADSTIQFGLGSSPVAAFVAPVKVCPNELFALTNNSKFSSKFSWDFGDGNSDSVYNPSYAFTKAGNYYIKLTVESNNGEISVDSHLVTVVPPAMADFIYTDTNLTVYITNTSTNATGYRWYWGDGKMGFTSTPTFQRTYDTAGIYTIMLVAINSDGCNDTTTYDVTLSNPNTSIGTFALNAESFSVQPNPFSNHLNVDFSLAQPSRVSMTMYNALGQQVTTDGVNDVFQAGDYNIAYPLQGTLKSGVYLLQININGQVFNKRIVRQ